MIHATYQFYSNVLGRMTRFHAILPRPQSLFQQADRAEAPKQKKCLWFFHGVGDCGEDVLLHTHIGDLSDAHDLIVVLPDLENSFCLDSDGYMRYESYLLDELIPMTEELLPISPRRETASSAASPWAAMGRRGLGCFGQSSLRRWSASPRR